MWVYNFTRQSYPSWSPLRSRFANISCRRLSDSPASILRGESGSGDSRSALTAVQAVDIVQAGLHWFRSTSRQISPVWNRHRLKRKKYLEMDIWMTYWSNEFDIRRDIWILLRDHNLQKPFSSYNKSILTERTWLPSNGVPLIPCSHPFHLNKSSSQTGERSFIAGLGSFDSLVNSFTSRAAVEWLIKQQI